MVLGSWGKLQLEEDVRHVPLYGGGTYHQLVRDPLVRQTLGHEAQNLLLLWCECVERAFSPRTLDHSPHDLGVEDRAALGDPSHRIGED